MILTENEIISALERMSEEDQNGFSSDILGVINRQKAEVERLQKANESFSCMGMLYSEIKSEARKEFAERSEKILIEKYNKYHLIANNTQLKDGVDMFYQGRAEAIWECIDINRKLLAEMDGENNETSS